MKIVCTGAPKSGTHLLLKAVRLFYNNIGLPFHEHVPHGNRKADAKYINIVRNPRNTLVSWLRYNRLPVDEKHLIQEMPAVIKEGAGYIGWLEDVDCLNVRFELMNTDPKEVAKIAAYIDKPLIENHYSKMWGGTKTFTGRLSHWPHYWTQAVNDRWVELGGINLENRLGYANSN